MLIQLKKGPIMRDETSAGGTNRDCRSGAKPWSTAEEHRWGVTARGTSKVRARAATQSLNANREKAKRGPRAISNLVQVIEDYAVALQL